MKKSILNTAALGFVLLLAIEFLDELVDGATGAAWPLVRDQLKLSYLEIGLLLSLPSLFGSLLEPIFGLLADTGRRNSLMLWGGVSFAVALLLFAGSTGFWPLLLALMVFNPASAAFVSLSQVALAEHDPARLEHNMARWALAGSLGNVVGPLLIGASVLLGLGWRVVFLVLVVLTLLLLWLSWRVMAATAATAIDKAVKASNSLVHELTNGLGRAWQALRHTGVWRWLLLLEAVDLLLDVFRGYVALYFVDVLHSGQTTASLALMVLTGVGLIGDALLLPLLERVAGLVYLRISATLVLLLFPAFLLAPLWLKLVLLGLIGILTAGWYSIIQARVYANLPGQSGIALALGNVSGFIGGLVPMVLGAIAEFYGLEAMMWCLLLGPIALLLGLWGQKSVIGEDVLED
jgi:MFS transporter, FSR family, fosmidomycin resistance protein